MQTPRHIGLRGRPALALQAAIAVLSSDLRTPETLLRWFKNVFARSHDGHSVVLTIDSDNLDHQEHAAMLCTLLRVRVPSIGAESPDQAAALTSVVQALAKVTRDSQSPTKGI